MEWISVGEKLPEIGQVALTYNVGYINGDAAVIYNKPDGSGFVLFYTDAPDIYLSPGKDFTHWATFGPPKK